MSKAKIFYGEYSLYYWIHLLLSQNIRLPKYQRTFVWDEDGVDDLIQSLRDGQFIPPVTIGAYREAEHGKVTNYIIDGQQRLTSILLSYIGYFPTQQADSHKDEIKTALRKLPGK